MDVAIVTGSSRGIGRETAIKLSKEFFVIVNYLRNHDKAMETVAKIESLGGKAIAVQGDVSKYEDAKRVTKVAKEYGDIRVLVNNAGVYDVKSFASSMPSEWERMFQVNVFGVMNMTHAVLDYMDSGIIANISSIIGLNPIPRAATYCASKAAVIAFTKSLSEELDPNIKVICVAPGPTDTDMLRKYHSTIFADPPEKVANFIIYSMKNARSGECLVVH